MNWATMFRTACMLEVLISGTPLQKCWALSAGPVQARCDGYVEGVAVTNCHPGRQSVKSAWHPGEGFIDMQHLQKQSIKSIKV